MDTRLGEAQSLSGSFGKKRERDGVGVGGDPGLAEIRTMFLFPLARGPVAVAKNCT